MAWERRLDRRLRAWLASVPGHVDLRAGRAPRLRLGAGGQAPNWVRIPVWLQQAWASGRSRLRGRQALEEVLWSQCALFLCIRLQDDLLDGQRGDLRVPLVADRLLVESLEVLQRFHELGSEFWAFYNDCIRSTVDGILEIGSLEKRAGAFTARHLGLHARVSAVLKVGTAAICRLHRRDTDAAWLSRLQDRLAILGQIRDDLQDLGSDLKEGRFTWVANVLLAARPGESLSPAARSRRLSEGLMRPERGAVIARELRRAARGAAAEVPASAPAPIHDLVRALSTVPDDLERSLHEARVRWVFRQSLESTSPSGRPPDSPRRTSKARAAP